MDRERETDQPRGGPYRGGRVHVADRRCATCIFRPGNLMRLRPGRVAAMVAEARANESAITCHATLGTAVPAICRGYWDRNWRAVWWLRLAVHLDVVTYDPAVGVGGV